MITSLVEQLKQEGITAEVIVGSDKQEAVDKYGKAYPFPVYTDADGTYYNEAAVEGVPYFIVTNSEGEIINRVWGADYNVKRMRRALEI